MLKTIQFFNYTRKNLYNKTMSFCFAHTYKFLFNSYFSVVENMKIGENIITCFRSICSPKKLHYVPQ